VVRSHEIGSRRHEIRTPLNGVLGLTRLLLDTPLTDVQREWADNAHASGRLLLALANQILDFARLESGKLVLTAEPFDVRELLEQVSRVCSVTTHRGINVLCRMYPGVPRHVIGDATRLQQILINIVGNAAKFTERGHIRIEAYASCVLSDPPAPVAPAAAAAAEAAAAAPADTRARVRLEFVISDSGPGIPDSLVGRLFDPFTQGDSSHTRKYGGAGLGLSIARRLAEAMDGGITLRSVQGQGTDFFVTVDLQLADTEWAPACSCAADDAAAVRVLVVSQAPAVAAFCTDVLREAGLPAATLPVEQAGAAPEAADRTADTATIAVIDGTSLMRQVAGPLSAAYPSLRVVMLSRPESSDDFDAGPADADVGRTVLYKPLLSCRLVDAVMAMRTVTASASAGCAADEHSEGT
jgi:hypothetical protein